jgi:hypothetical protein
MTQEFQRKFHFQIKWAPKLASPVGNIILYKDSNFIGFKKLKLGFSERIEIDCYSFTNAERVPSPFKVASSVQCR